jgi:hypothetical protein
VGLKAKSVFPVPHSRDVAAQTQSRKLQRIADDVKGNLFFVCEICKVKSKICTLKYCPEVSNMMELLV